MKCLNCGIEFEGRAGAKFCSPKCRVTFSRKQSVVTDNVTFSEPVVTDNFEYTISSYDLNLSFPERKVTATTYTKKYWYDVPLGAVPIIHKGWPDMPDYMNGRQYFLWWKNEFKLNDKGEPIILNPYPKLESSVEYIRAAEGSRRLGA